MAGPALLDSRTVPSSRLEISIECRNLWDRDVTSKSDPMCVCRLEDPISKSFNEIGRTERIENNLNPKFATKINIIYYFEQKQTLKFELYDCDSSSTKLESHDSLGSLTISLPEIVQGKASRGQGLSLQGGKKGTIIVRANDLVESRESYVISFSGRHLDNKDFFSKSDPYLVIHKQVADGSFSPVAKTNVVNNSLNPDWAPIRVNCATFCNKDDSCPMLFECFDYDNDGSHDFIGSFQTTPKQLFDKIGSQQFDLINPKKQQKKKNYTNSGVLLVSQMSVEEDCEFIYYIQAGLQLNFIVAIDFTGSNGDPAHPRSLHYFDPHNPVNQYTTAIEAVGNIIQDYDTDKLFPCFGFGGVFQPGQPPHFNFPMNYNFENPNVMYVQGIIDAYKYTLQQVKLWGPTNFEPCIRSAIATASQFQSGLHYFVLLIITDGAITDLDKTKEAIVEASRYPMSLIIVGVGDAEFDSMDELDSDQQMLRGPFSQRPADRDIVQFVALRDVLKRSGRAGDMYESKARLAQEVLAEIPNQVSAYLRKRRIFPSDVFRLYQQAFPAPPQPASEQSASQPDNP